MFCFCQSGVTYLCESCLTKHAGHETYPVDRYELLQLLNLDRELFRSRIQMNAKCREFIAFLTDREAVIRTEIGESVRKLSQAVEQLMERRHRGFETLIELLTEETDMLLTSSKLRISPLTQALQDKFTSLGQREVDSFLIFPELAALKDLINTTEEAGAGSQRAWQREYEDKVLSAIVNESPVTLRQPDEVKETVTVPEVPVTAFSLLEIQDAVPDYLTPASKSALEHFGAYPVQYDESQVVTRGPVSLESGVYVGQWNSQQQRHGYGKMTWQDGQMYEGFWRNDKRQGKGRSISAKGEVFIGDFESDQMNGFGVQYDVEGGVYVGGFSAGKRNGVGRIQAGSKSSIAGGVYMGEFSAGNIQGSGFLLLSDNSVYAGNWKNGYKHGRGFFLHASSAIYSGEYQDGQFSGPGRYIWPEGHVYNGEWKAGKRWGIGRMTQPGLEFYEGPWVEDKEHGVGKYRCRDGRDEQRHYRNGTRLLP